MDSRHHCPPCICQAVEESNEVESSCGVQASSRLIKEDHGGVNQQLHADRSPLLLSS